MIKRPLTIEIIASSDFNMELVENIFAVIKLERDNDGIITREQIITNLIKFYKLTKQEQELEFISEKSGIRNNAFGNRVSWNLDGLKKAGLAINEFRGQWKLTPEGEKMEFLDIKDYYELIRTYKKRMRKQEQLEDSVWKAEPLPKNQISDDEQKKREMLAEILAQNKRILDYLKI